MTYESSKLVWYTDKPKFEDVKGKTVYVEYSNGLDETILKRFTISLDADQFRVYFGYGSAVVRWAILDLTQPEPEILELDGVMPRIWENDGVWFASFSIQSREWHEFKGDSRIDVICKWNAFVKRMGGEG